MFALIIPAVIIVLPVCMAISTRLENKQSARKQALREQDAKNLAILSVRYNVR